MKSKFPYDIENDFSSEPVHALFLIKEDFRWRPKQRGFQRIHSVGFIAGVDCGTNELIVKPGSIYQVGTIFSRNITRQFKPNRTYKLRVKKCQKDPNIFLFISCEGVAADDRLSDILKTRVEPKTIDTPYCAFSLDRPYNEYTGTWEKNGADINIILEIEECSTNTDVQLIRMKDICENYDTRLAAVLEEIAGTEWLKEWVSDAGEVTDGFERRLGPPSILCFMPDGSMQFWFDGGGTFGGHSIVVDVDKENKITGIDLPG